MDEIEEIVKRYREKQALYEGYAKAIQGILESAISAKDRAFRYHNIKSRSKTIESFRKKAGKIESSENNQLKYKNPLTDITDLAGVRVIVYLPKEVKVIEECIKKEFEVKETRDVGKERFDEGMFGYHSHHYLVSITKDRLNLPEYTRYGELTGEIQLRTVLQHAWAEMEHDIIYKSSEQVPTLIKRKFVTLAGMLEIADNEFQKIQDADKDLRNSISSSLQDELTNKIIQEKSATDKTDKTDETQEISQENVRDLIANKEYDKAIAHYAQLIKNEPKGHTFYIGSARAKFLAGDREGALKDIEKARELHPDDTSPIKLKNQIEEGTIDVIAPTTITTTEAWVLTSKGNKSLSNGNGKEAFEHYIKAEQRGHNPHYSTLNKAMACALTKDHQGTFHILSDINLINNSMMEINVFALRLIAAIIGDNPSVHDQRHELSDKLKNVAYDFNLSPLKRLQQGFNKSHTIPPKLMKHIQEVFSMLDEENDDE